MNVIRVLNLIDEMETNVLMLMSVEKVCAPMEFVEIRREHLNVNVR